MTDDRDVPLVTSLQYSIFTPPFLLFISCFHSIFIPILCFIVSLSLSLSHPLHPSTESPFLCSQPSLWVLPSVPLRALFYFLLFFFFLGGGVVLSLYVESNHWGMVVSRADKRLLGPDGSQ